jgi:hypothetical protein
MKTGNVIASTIALVWALAVFTLRFAGHGSTTSGSGAFHAGQTGGQVLLLAIGIAGARGLIKEFQRSRAS